MPESEEALRQGNVLGVDTREGARAKTKDDF